MFTHFHRFSDQSTSVYGGGSTTTASGKVQVNAVRSSFNYHQDQKIWVNWDDGTTQALDFYNQNINARAGQRVRMYYSSFNKRLSRFVNITTGEYWRISGNGRWMSGVVDDKGSKKLYKTNRFYKPGFNTVLQDSKYLSQLKLPTVPGRHAKNQKSTCGEFLYQPCRPAKRAM